MKRFSLLLLDRDNVIVHMPSGQRYLYGDDPISLVPGAANLIRSANKAGVPVGVATNQRGIALASYPEMTEATVSHFNIRMRERLRAEGANIGEMYVCPHDESDNCDCRKPKPGLILRALKDFAASKRSAVFIGDRATDLEAAIRAGITGILVGDTNELVPKVRDQAAFSTLVEAQEFLEPRWQPAIRGS